MNSSGSSEIVTLVSTHYENYFPKNDASSFVNVLKPLHDKKISNVKVCLESLCFQPSFTNVPNLEDCRSHLIAFRYRNFNSDRDSEILATPRLWHQPVRLRITGQEKYENNEELLEMINRVFRGGWGEDCLRFEMGNEGIEIEGEGVILLASPKFMEWVKIPKEGYSLVVAEHSSYFLIDLSDDDLSVLGFETDLLKVTTPDFIHVKMRCEEGSWPSVTLAMIPFKYTDGDELRNFFCNRECKEYVAIGRNNVLDKIKIEIQDGNGQNLRLVNNRERPTYVRLKLEEMDERRSFILRINEKAATDFRTNFRSPLISARWDRWQMALLSAFIPASFTRLNDMLEEMRVDYIFGEESGAKNIPATSFESNETLITEISKIIYELSRQRCIVDTINGRIRFTFSGLCDLNFSNKLSVILGLAVIVRRELDYEVKGKIGTIIVGANKIDVLRQRPVCVALHCNIVEPSIYGSGMNSILDLIPIPTEQQELYGKSGKMISYEAKNLTFVNIDSNSSFVPNILFSLRTLEEELLTFHNSESKIYLNIIFREKI